jgi:hypothetical protein
LAYGTDVALDANVEYVECDRPDCWRTMPITMSRAGDHEAAWNWVNGTNGWRTVGGWADGLSFCPLHADDEG